MKLSGSVAAVTVAALTLAVLSGSAEAKGCIKGALVGGAAGHLAHHGLLGAAAGCIIGHHEAAKHERELHDQPSGAAPAPASAPATAPDPGKYQ